MFIPLLAAIAGLALARTDILNIYWAIPLLAGAVLALLLLRQRVFALILLLGALWGAADLFWDARQVNVDASWLHGNVEISADIERVEVFSGYQRLRLRHISRSDGAELAGKALVYQHHSKTGDIQLHAGQRIRALTHWRLPRNYHNPGAFDYRGWCFDHHIALIGSIKGTPTIIQATVPWLEQQRQKVRAVIAKADRTYRSYKIYKSNNVSNQPPHPTHNGVLRAVLLGERSQISAHANAVFATTGTAHLLAISGMHVGMAAAWVFALVWLILTRREAWMVNLPVRNIAMICGFLAAAAYATLAGWPLPAIRAAMMLAAAAAAWCLIARSEPVNTLLAALGLILLLDAAAIASLSLWLSFMATAALLLWAGKHKNNQHDAAAWIMRIATAGKSILWISLLATLATLPLIVATFGRVPVYTLPANIIMVPLYALIVMPLGLLAEVLALLGLDAISLPLMHVASLGVDMGLGMLSWISALPESVLWASAPALWMQLMYGLGMAGAGVWLWRGQQMRAAFLSALVLSAWLALVLHETDISQPQWIVWDVGQGAASTLLLPGNRVIAVDAPGRAGSRFNGGTTEAAGLRSMGITHLDVLALSHAQSDHLGGALSLLKNMNHIGEIWLPDVPSARNDAQVNAIVAYAQSHGGKIRWLSQGDSVALDGKPEFTTHISVLWPPRGFDPANANNTSLVLAVHLANGKRLLWPGDIEAEAETAMLAAASIEKTDVMLMPHHGSGTSSQPRFVTALQPSISVAQTGFGNRYGFPKPAVVDRYRAMGVAVRNTANGAVLVRWREGGVSVESWQSQRIKRRELAMAWWQSW